MSRIWWIVAVLLATGAVLAEDVPERVEPATEAEVRETATVADAEADGAAEETIDRSEEPNDDGPKLISGMSILGNQEAPKSLVIVPWKSSEIGASLGIPTMLDDSVLPVDRDVFLRALSYYEIRSETAP